LIYTKIQAESLIKQLHAVDSGNFLQSMKLEEDEERRKAISKESTSKKKKENAIDKNKALDETAVKKLPKGKAYFHCSN
jgi:hypothetical protein